MGCHSQDDVTKQVLATHYLQYVRANLGTFLFHIYLINNLSNHHIQLLLKIHNVIFIEFILTTEQSDEKKKSL